MIGENKMSVTVGSGTAVIAVGAEELDLKRHRRPGEAVIHALLFACGILSIFTTLGIIFVLAREALLFFQRPEVTVL
jgi:phosphate transport system permease protein